MRSRSVSAIGLLLLLLCLLLVSAAALRREHGPSGRGTTASALNGLVVREGRGE